MLPLRYRWWWLGAGVAALVIILALALAPLTTRLPIIQGDKVAHALAFMLLTIWFSGVFAPRVAPQLTAALLGYGVLIEILQSFMPYRSADPYDVLSDLVGISAGWLLASVGLRHWCGRVEALLGASPLMNEGRHQG
jgi:VanZ family protein